MFHLTCLCHYDIIRKACCIKTIQENAASTYKFFGLCIPEDVLTCTLRIFICSAKDGEEVMTNTSEVPVFYLFADRYTF